MTTAGVCRALAGGFGAGRVSFAPGTAGTLAAIPVAWALAQLPLPGQSVLLLLCLPLGAAVCGRAARDDGRKDPGWIVLDEVVGYCYAVALLRPGLGAYGAAFFLFRVFDILKPPPAGWIDRSAPGGWGILLDDVFAGLYARLFLWLLGRFGVL